MSRAAVNTRVPIDVAYVTFHDDELPATGLSDARKTASNLPSPVSAAAKSSVASAPSFVLTTGGFPQEVIFSTRSSFANVSRIVLTLDDAKDIVVERCTAVGEPSAPATAPKTPLASGAQGTDPMSATYEVIAERTVERGEPESAGGSSGAAAADTVRRQRQLVTLELDATSAGKGIRALKLRILSGYSDFVAVCGISVYGEVSEQRIAVLESKPEVSM